MRKERFSVGHFLNSLSNGINFAPGVQSRVKLFASLNSVLHWSPLSSSNAGDYEERSRALTHDELCFVLCLCEAHFDSIMDAIFKD